MDQHWECLDGNEAAARVAYAVSEVDLDLPDHAGLAHGGARRRLGRRRAARTCGARCPRWSRCSRRAGAAGALHGALAEGGPGHDLHGVAGPAADDPEHVQDRGRADAGRDPRGGPHHRDPRPVDLRRPQRRDARPHHGLGDARGRLRAGGPRLRAGRPRSHPAGPRAVPPLLRRFPHVARDQQDRRCSTTTTSRPSFATTTSSPSAAAG